MYIKLTILSLVTFFITYLLCECIDRFVLKKKKEIEEKRKK